MECTSHDYYLYASVIVSDGFVDLELVADCGAQQITFGKGPHKGRAVEMRLVRIQLAGMPEAPQEYMWAEQLRITGGAPVLYDAIDKLPKLRLTEKELRAAMKQAGRV